MRLTCTLAARGDPRVYPVPSSTVTVTVPSWLLALLEVCTVSHAWLEPVMVTCAVWLCPYPLVKLTFRFTTVSPSVDSVSVNCAFCPSFTDSWSGAMLTSGRGGSSVLASRAGDHGLLPATFSAMTCT